MDGWPETVPVEQIPLIEAIGWDALMMVNEGQFNIERDDADQVIGIRFDLALGWWVVVVGTADGYSVGRFRAMVPFEWVHGLALGELTYQVQRAAGEASLKDPD